MKNLPLSSLDRTPRFERGGGRSILSGAARKIIPFLILFFTIFSCYNPLAIGFHKQTYVCYSHIERENLFGKVKYIQMYCANVPEIDKMVRVR